LSGMAFILFDLEFQISLNSFGNQQIKKEKDLPAVLLAAWRPARVGLPCSLSLIGQRTEPPLPAPAWAGPGTTAARALPSLSR
jgi:hypothetical protein